MKNLFSVKDKVVIITGANGGIGNALALGFAKNQSVVYGIGLKTPNTKSPNVFYHKCDVSKPKQFANSKTLKSFSSLIISHDIIFDSKCLSVISFK